MTRYRGEPSGLAVFLVAIGILVLNLLFLAAAVAVIALVVKAVI